MFRIFCVSFVLTGISNSFAESVKDLEQRILQGNTKDSPTESSTADETQSADSTSSVDVDVPEVKEDSKEVFQSTDLQAIEDAIKGPQEIPQSHIMIVQRRYIKKEGRHEFDPVMVGFQPADSFRQQLQFGFGYVYHLTESFGLEALHFTVTRNFNTGLASAIRSTTGLEVDRIEPVISVGASLQWTPLQAKSGGLTSINYFEGYFLGGGGASRYENQNCAMAMWGLGFRIYLTKFAIFKTELRDYIDFKSGGTDYRFNVIAGLGVLLGGGK